MTYTEEMELRYSKAIAGELLGSEGWATAIVQPLLPALDRETSDEGAIIPLPPERQFCVYEKGSTTYKLEFSSVELQPGVSQSFWVSGEVGLGTALQRGFASYDFVREVLRLIAEDCRKTFQRVGTTHKAIVYDPFSPSKPLWEPYAGSYETTSRLLHTLRFIEASVRLNGLFNFRRVIYPPILDKCFDSRLLPDVGWCVSPCKTFEASDVEPAVYVAGRDAFFLYVTEPGVKTVWFPDIQQWQVDLWMNWGIRLCIGKDSLLDVIPIDNRSGMPY